MNKLLASALLVISASSWAAENWTPVKSGPLGNTAEISTPGKKVELIWANRISPGEQLLLTKAVYTRYEITYFHRYVFTGIEGNSARIESSGASQEKGQKSAQSDKSFEKVMLIERSKDGSFYFAPSDIKDEAVFRISGPLDRSSDYEVTLEKATK